MYCLVCSIYIVIQIYKVLSCMQYIYSYTDIQCTVLYAVYIYIVIQIHNALSCIQYIQIYSVLSCIYSIYSFKAA